MDNGLMTVIHSTKQFSIWRSSIANDTVALVATMGALHQGHTALITHAAAECKIVVVSIFINALQFGDPADFEKYPRTLARDCQVAIDAGATIIFAPTQQDIFPSHFDRYITPSPLARDFEGKSRPGHFAGVVTVVNRLFEIVQPHVAVFGAKDYQQVAVIRAMSRQLHPEIKILTFRTVRDTDGLALSSRNVHLNPQARVQSQVIPRALHALEILYSQGQTDSSILKNHALSILETESEMSVEYLEIVNQDSLQPQSDARGTVVLFAGIIDGVRLIDNMLLI